MTTLKDKIRDALIEFCTQKNVHPDPDEEVLVEAIMEEIKEYVQNVLLTD